VAASELRQRGRVKAMLPMLVGETDFWSKAHRARSFRWDTGHVDAILVGHDGEGGDAPGANDRRRLFCRKYVSFCSKWVEALACILKFQGLKLSQTRPATAHSHGHVSVAMDDRTECTGQIQATMASCLKRVRVDAM
jgi:hypothetical protein